MCKVVAQVGLAFLLSNAGGSLTTPAAEWVNGAGYRSRPLGTPSSGTNGFALLAPSQTGLDFTNTLAAARSITNHVLLNGSGVAAGDVDGDSLIDLYFCGLDGSNRLYRNLGNWRFEDITQAAGVACPGLDATGAAFVDLDGDGDLDLIVNSTGGGTHLFFNDGKGHFSPAPKSVLLNQGQAGTSLALADMDGDGALDLYITNYRPMFFFQDKPETRYSVRTVNGQPQVAFIDGRPLTDPEFTNRFVFQVHMAEGKVTLAKEELGQVDALYHNDGHGGFTLVPFTGGAFLDEEGKPLSEPPRDWGLSVMFRDLNGDGFPDLYVCNDFRTPDRIWINDGHGRFNALPRLAMRQTCLSAMGMDVADVNRDGAFDIFVADMLSPDHAKRLTQRIDLRPEALAPGQIDNRPQFSRNMLQLSRGDGTFAEIVQLCGLEAADWAWSPVFLDVDLDGFEDLLVANGFERDTMNVDMQRRFEMLTHQQKLTGLDRLKLRRLYPRLDTPNLAFRNLGNGKFAEMSAAWGFDTPAISQGMCLADLDNDGDLDVIVNNMNGPAGLYRNNAGAPRVAVRLKGRPPNTQGIGARIELFGGPVYQSQEMICGGRYCSSDDPMRTFAAGTLTNDLTLVIRWRSGQHTVVEGVRGNRLYEIEESAAIAPPGLIASADKLRVQFTSMAWLGAPNAPDPAHPVPVFQDVSALLNHAHRDELFDDFLRQPLVPVKLSQPGPGVSWFDFDHDGWEDLAIGSGKGGRLSIFHNTGKGTFELLPTAPGDLPTTRDQTTILGWRQNSGGGAWLVGSSSYEDGQATGGAVLLMEPGKAMRELVPGDMSSAGALAMADIDGDGDLDLFVGGRVHPGRYPEPASSRLFRSDQGQFTLDQANSRLLEKVGLVSGAVFTDLDNDGWPDLVLACEWGPIRIFKNTRGHFTEATQQLGLAQYTGWWNGVTVGDFDEDGRLDIVASNWGRNTRYEHFRQQPLRLAYGDFNGDGGVQMLETFVDPKTQRAVPWRRLDEVTRAMPFLNARFSTLEEFGKASLADVLGDKAAAATVLEATCLESMVFLNRGDHFQAQPLPLEAQLAPAFALCVGDLDGDGHDDLFLSQNFFAVQSEMSRYDAGRGLWLRGDGRGGFQAVPGQQSGLLIYGEQRGAALCDYDGDGRPDLVVGQNGAQTRLFHNATGRPGLRVRLHGPLGNEQAIGAVLRLGNAHQAGPAREIHAGSGYWSQDSAVAVMSLSEPATYLEIRWPGGKTIRYPLPASPHAVEADPSGTLRLIK